MIIDSKKRYLMIVESPNKVKTISSILKDLGYSNIVVKASVGHITSIKDSGIYNMGIDPDKDFNIDFKISDDKKDIVFKLNNSTCGRGVYHITSNNSLLDVINKL